MRQADESGDHGYRSKQREDHTEHVFMTRAVMKFRDEVGCSQIEKYSTGYPQKTW